MPNEAVARRLELPADEEFENRGFGGGPPAAGAPAINNARLGLFMFLGAEAMFFAGLIGAFLVFRLGSEVWPPPSQPRLPVVVTGVNTLILLLSGFTVRWALKAVQRGNTSGLVRWLGSTAALGLVFLGVQGFEWVRLVDFGLKISTGTYGSTFYTLIGFHALHVVGAVLWLICVLARAYGGRFSARSHTGVEIFSMYWLFVVGLWPLLYGLVYLY